MSDTQEIDEVEKYSGVTIKDSVTTCGDESSSVYIPVIFARQLERERNKAREELKKLEGAYEDATNYYARIIELKEEIDALKTAIRETLEENRPLADGDDCTLRKLKQLVPDWE